MRPIWKGYLTFGLVTIPVRVYSATERGGISFNQLHNECHNRIRYQKYCPACDEVVEQEEIVKGYDLGGDRYVVLSDEELEQFDAEATKGIEIVNFVKASDVDPIYFEKPYYLEPADIGHKAYKLLRMALGRSGKAALAKVVMRHRESLALVRLSDQCLVLNMLHWPAEIRSTEWLEELNVDPEVSEKELETALVLVDALTTEFDPSAYPDEYAERLRALIDEKAAGEEFKLSEGPPRGRQVIDLMEALEASLKATKPNGREKTEKRKGA